MAKYKYILTIIITLCTIITYAQPAQYTPMTASGYQMKRLKVDSTLHLPSFCGVPTILSSTAKEGALAIDTCGGLLYMWTRTGGWDTINVSGGSSTDTTSLSNRINLKIDSLKRSNDSVYAYRNGTRVFQFKDSVGGGTIPTLQQVTNSGSTTTNTISVNSLNIGTVGSKINLSGYTNNLTIYNEGTSDEILNVTNGSTGSLKFGGGAYNYVEISNSATGNVNLQAPSTSGTIPVSVNNNFADAAGNITITSTLDTTNQFVKRLDRTPGKDSIIYFVGANRFAIKDSVGTGGSSQNGRFGNDTATVVMVKVHNESGTVLTNGKVVAFSHSGTQSNEPAVRLANNKHDSTSANTLGFVSGTIAINDTGWVILSGKIEKLNTSAFSNGDIIYLDSINGLYTNTKPIAPYHMVYLGVVVKSNAGNGSIFVKAQNGYELFEIHDVKITSALNNQVLAYSDTQKVWKNRNIYSVVDTTNTIATKSNVALKLNISDTANMLSTYSTRINGKLNISDTANMLSTYSTRINGKLNISDTANMLSTYSTRINGKLNIADTSTLQRKSIPAYSILANNTSATANVTAQQFRDTSGVYSGTITWTGTTAPSGATNHTYRLTQVGKCVTLHIALVFATNGASLTAVQMTLPSGAPVPAQPTGLTGSIFNMYPVKVELVNTSNQVILSSSARGFVRNNTGATGFEIYATFVGAAVGQVGVIAQYWTN